MKATMTTKSPAALLKLLRGAKVTATLETKQAAPPPPQEKKTP